MSFTLPELPYAADALAPYVSAETFSFHHGKHHATYVTNLNNLTKDTDLATKSVEEIIKSSTGGLFNNAAQHFNHSFFWKSMKPNGGGAPNGAIAEAIEKDLGGYEKFKTAFMTTANTHFGSGWAWLVLNKDKKLEVVGTHDACTPITDGLTPLVTIDVWEHAYYIDYRNARPKFTETFMDHLLNWDFANENYTKAMSQ